MLLDNIHESILKMKNVKLSDGKIADTTFIGRIFGGYLRNELKCSKCNYSSQTFNHFLDLSLEITKGISCVTDALKAFTAKERLDCGNEWKCEKCKMKVQATKQLMISTAPVILTIHLKRFNYNGKINKHIGFNLVEEVPCITTVDGVDKVTRVKYHLYAFIVHHGHSTHSGHYVAYVKAPNDQWCEMNDSTVSRCSSTNLFQQEAYVLFYRKQVDAAITPTASIAPVPSNGVLPVPAADDTGMEVKTKSTAKISAHKTLHNGGAVKNALHNQLSKDVSSALSNGASSELDDAIPPRSASASGDESSAVSGDSDSEPSSRSEECGPRVMGTMVRPRCFMGIRGKFLRGMNSRLPPVRQLYIDKRGIRNKYLSLLDALSPTQTRRIPPIQTQTQTQR